MTVTSACADFTTRLRLEDVPADAVKWAKWGILDCTGVTIAGAATQLSAVVQDYLEFVGGNPQARIVGLKVNANAVESAMANGALAHALDFEDAYDGAPVHPNAAAVPVALALAERSPEIDGRRLIAALGVGCDLVCRLGLCLRDNPDRYGFFTPPILGAFGAAATAARLLELDEERVVAAFALTLTQATSS